MREGRGQLAIITQKSRQCLEAQLAIMKHMSRQVSRSSTGDYQADEQAGVTRLIWRVSGR